MYKNNELIATNQAGSRSNLDITDYSLTNSVSSENNAKAYNVVEDIIGINGVISSSNLYYLNSLLDTII